MPLWIQIEAGMLYHHISDSEISVKLVTSSGQFYVSSQSVEDLSVSCTKFNPQLQLSENVIVKLLDDALKNASNLAIEDAVLKLSAPIDRLQFKIAFKWDFELSTCTNMIEQVFNPILNSMILLIEEKNTLTSLLKKKDKEISEFRSLGMSLSKKSKLSAPYDPVKTLKNVQVSKLLTSDILSNGAFKEAIEKSFQAESTTKSSCLSKRKKAVVPTGITFDDSFSQPDPVFTDADIMSEPELKDDIVSDEDAQVGAVGKIEEKSSANAEMPVMKRKKPRRL